MFTKGERDGERGWDKHTHTTMYKTDNPTRTYCITQESTL